VSVVVVVESSKCSRVPENQYATIPATTITIISVFQLIFIVFFYDLICAPFIIDSTGAGGLAIPCGCFLASSLKVFNVFNNWLVVMCSRLVNQ